MKVNTNINTLMENKVGELPFKFSQKIIDHSPIAFIVSLANGTILFSNKSATNLFGYTREEILTTNLNRLILPASANLVGSKKEEEFHLFLGKRKDGTLFSCDVAFTSYEDEDGSVKTTTTILSRPERSNSELSNELDLVLNYADESFLVINKNFEVLLFNKVLADRSKERLGLELKKGFNCLLLAPADKREAMKPMLETVFQGETISFEITSVINNGQTVHTYNTIKPLKNGGEITGAVITTKDITEKKRSDAAVMQSEQRWRFALEGSNQGVWDWDIQSGTTYYSSSWKKILGYNEDEIGNTLSEWETRLHPDDRAVMKQHRSRHLSQTNPYYETEFRLQAKDGSYRWILSRGMIMSKSPEGKPLRMIGTHTDITERKTIEENYKLLFNNNPLPMWTYDRSTLKFLQVNNAAIAHYGYSREEFLSMTILDIRTPEHRQCVLEAHQSGKITGKLFYAGMQHLRKNGDIIYVNATLQTFIEDDTEICLVLAQDVTENIFAERKIKQSEEQYRLLFKNNPLPSCIYDPESLRFLEVNDAFISSYGYTRDEFLKMSLLDIHLPEEHQSVKDSIKRNRKATNTVVTFWTHQRKNGEQIIVECSRNSMEYMGVPARLVVLKDITEKVRAENKLKETNERYELTTKATSDAIYDWNILSDEIKWGEGFSTLFGYEEQISVAKWASLLHEEDKEIYTDLNQTLYQTKDTLWREEYRFKKADGTYSDILERGFIVRDEDGKPIRMIGSMQDISEIKAKEKELRESNERYQFVLQATSDIIWDWNLETGNILFSDNYQHILGWQLPEDKLISFETNKSRFHPDDREATEINLAEAIKNKDVNIWDTEFRYLKSDNTYAYIANKSFILRSPEGKALRFIGATHDITQRKYQEELQALELRIFEMSVVPGVQFTSVLHTLISGFETIHPEISAAISLAAGSPDDIEIMAPALNRQQLKSLRRLIEKQKTLLEDNPDEQKNLIVFAPESKDAGNNATDPKGITFWTVPVYQHKGRVLGFMTISSSKEKPTEFELSSLAHLRNLLRILIVNHLSLEQIRISNERFDNALKATNDMIWDWNLETGTFYRNQEGLKRVYGVHDENSVKNVYNWMERIHPGDHKKVQWIINDILHATNQDTFDVEYRIKKDDGEYSYIYDRGIIVRNSSGKPLRMIGAAQNITDRKRLEQELLQKELDKQKLISQATIDTQEQERREIGKELHDNVNQVLTTTKLYLDLSLSSPELKDELIRKSSKNVIYVINEIRQLSRSLMDPSIGDLGLIDSINDLVENINITRKLHVTLDADAKLEKQLQENQKLMIFRIIQEALNNTIKYAQATSVQISITGKAKNLELVIADDGKGFKAETVKKGAGLKNIQNRVYLTSGKLLIDTAPGKGCKITINFPINNHNNNSN